MNNPQIRLSRKVATVPVVAGQFAFVDLPRQYDYEAVFLRIAGALVVSVGAATAVRAEAPLQTLARIEVIADGKNTLYSLPGHMAALTQIDRPILQNGARVTTPPSGVAVATYQVEAVIPIDFSLVKGLRQKDTNFRTSALSLFQLRLTFGLAADNFVVGGATVAFSNMNVDVFTQELIEFAGKDGKFSMPIALKKVSYQEITLAAANTEDGFNLPAGNFIGLIAMRAEGNVTAGEPSTTMLNNVQAKSGEDTRLNLAAANLRAKNNADYGYITPGYYFWDPMALGPAEKHMTNAWDATAQLQPKMVIDHTGGANQKLQIATTELIFAR